LAKILVVDDDPAMVEIVLRMLELVGHNAVPCSGGELVLGIIGNEAFDLILTDIYMPGMTGADLILNVRELQPQLPIIAMSGSAEEDPQAALAFAASLGAAGVLQKPFSTQDLFKVIDDVLSRRPAARRCAP
jgi:CheY-like chemotaxis protein